MLLYAGGDESNGGEGDGDNMDDGGNGDNMGSGGEGDTMGGDRPNVGGGAVTLNYILYTKIVRTFRNH